MKELIRQFLIIFQYNEVYYKMFILAIFMITFVIISIANYIRIYFTTKIRLGINQNLKILLLNHTTYLEYQEYAKKEKLEDNYQTILGERGINLSGEQKQRISIAKTLIQDKKVIIFDDILSKLDNITKEIMKNRICFLIAHRLSSVESCDKIFLLEDGKIVEEGSHNALLEQKGKYYKLINT